MIIKPLSTIFFLWIFHLIFLSGVAAEDSSPALGDDVHEAGRQLAKTGSLRNCTPTSHQNKSGKGHVDSSYVTVSCEHIHYRIPKQSLIRMTQSRAQTSLGIAEKESIIIGVLSGSGIPERRTSIRSTWGYRRRNVFFIVGGPWEDIQEEYDEYGDILWIDKEEIYITETSVLTLKTETFLSVMYERVMKGIATSGIEYLFKTDDDSYVELQKLHATLSSTNTGDYWGKCNEGGWKPHRNTEIAWQRKWYISYETYAEPEYPPFCQGAGFALSRKFLDCAVGDGHVAKVKYMPNEDVAVGMLAERCGVVATNDDRVWIRWEGEITMENKIIQHYVKGDDDMRLHHQSATGVMGPIII
jgi:hypothetical protein